MDVASLRLLFIKLNSWLNGNSPIRFVLLGFAHGDHVGLNA